jgi:8-oxo-dGTP pyrophosphatase MutT (NUDIX family)
MREALRAALAGRPHTELPALPGRTNHLRAGVLVPLALDGGVTAFVVERAATLARHAGEIGFPGGRPEPEDADLQATALREAMEEAGIIDVDVLGRLSSMPVYTSDFRLEPFVGAVGAGPWRADGSEIVDVLTVDVLALLARPHLDAVAFTWAGRTTLSPVFDVGRARPMFGASAYTFMELLGLVADARGVTVPTLREARWRIEDLVPDYPRARDHG